MLIKKLFKEIFFWSIPFLLLIALLFFIKILKKDFIFSHYLYATSKPPHNWMYDLTFTPLKKFYIKLKNDNNDYLPKVRLYLSESKINYLLSDIPKSVKEWQRGKIIHDFDRKNLKNIQIRLRGDNPANWISEKQSFRVKLRKSEMHDRKRYFNYIPFQIKLFTSTRMAENSGVLTTNIRPVELLMNDTRKGLYLEIEDFNENYLRRNRFMPVNFYKGENFNQESKIALPRYLYSNPGLWSKEAYFNFFKEDNKYDLKNFLNILKKSSGEKQIRHLYSYLDDEYIGRYLAYTTLVQNYHTSRFHNNRLIIDPWKGQVFPVVTDSYFDFRSDTNFDHSSNDLTSVLNQTAKFIHLKYKYLGKLLFEEKIIDKEIEYLHKNKEKIVNVMKNDPVLVDLFPKFFKIQNYQVIENTIKDLKYRKKTLIDELTKKPETFWVSSESNFSIISNDTLPISDIILSFDDKVPDWVFIDENYNNYLDNNEIKFYRKGDKIKLDVTLYANRVNSTHYYNLFNNDISIAPTKFNFVTSNNIFPKKIEFSNIFIKNSKIIKKLNKKPEAYTLNYKNKIILEENKISNSLEKITLSGTILVSEDRIFSNPVIIKPGTTFLIEEGKNLIFTERVEAIGQENKKIKFLSKSDKPWGTLAIIGKKTSGSKLKNIIIKDGSGSFSDQFYFTSTLSIHNTSNVDLENISLSNNHSYDDMIHLIYSSNIKLKELNIFNAYGDALDIDMCENIIIENSQIYNSKNDGIDLMESDTLIKNVKIVGSLDKGISIGEASKTKILKSSLINNYIAVAVKDKSQAKMNNINFYENDIQIAAYKKNLQYGSGGNIDIQNSFFRNKLIKFNSQNSSINISNSKLKGKIIKNGKNIVIND